MKFSERRYLHRVVSHQIRSAVSVLAAVKETMSQHGAEKVAIVGFSLGKSVLISVVNSVLIATIGAAVALLDSIYLPLHLPSSITYKTITYGMPRVSCLLYFLIKPS